jgi:cytoskeletal protein CcmA (bactofilin family)
MSKWLDLSNSANKLKNTYVRGILDVSGGGIYLRNDMSLNFYDKTGSTIPKFSINSEFMRIPDKFGAYYDLSISQLLYLNNLSSNIDSQFSNLVNKTKYITSDSTNIDTILEIDGGTNKKIVAYADIIPAIPFAYNLGTPTSPFGSLYVKQGTIHFVDETTNSLGASISYDAQVGSLDLSTNGIVSSLNNTRLVNGILQQPLLSYGGNVGIGVSNPTHALDISGNVNITGSSRIQGNLNINNGDVIMDGNLIIGATIFEKGIPLSEKYLSTAEPTINGTATMQKAIVKAELTVLGDASMNQRLFVGGDVSMNANLVVLGRLLANTPITSDNSTLVATTQFVKNQGYAALNSPNFLGSVTMVNNTISQKLTVGGDVSLNSKLSVFSTATLNNRLYVNNDAFFNTNVIISGDSSFNANVNVGGLLTSVTPNVTDNSNKAATTRYVQNQGYAKLAGSNFTGDVAINTKLTVDGDVSFNANVNVGGLLISATPIVSDNSNKVATTAFIKNQGYAPLVSPAFTGAATLQDVSIYDKLFVSGDSTMVGNLNVNGNMTATTQFNNDNSNKVATTQFIKNQGYSTVNSPTFTGIVTVPFINVTKDLQVLGDSSFNGRLFIGSDVSTNGDMNIGGELFVKTQNTDDNSTKAANTAFIKNQGYAKLSGSTFTGDISLNTNLFVGGDVSLNHQLTVFGTTNLLGNTYAVTQITSDESDKIATTAYVKSQRYSTLNSPAFTGIVTAPTPVYGDSSTQIATTEFVVNELFSFINSNEQVYNSLQQLSNALSNTDSSFATTLAQSLGLKADKSSPIFLGTATIPTLNVLSNLYSLGDVSLNTNLFVGGDASINGNLYSVTQISADNSTKVATTEFVKNQGYAQLSGATFSGLLKTLQDLRVEGNTTLNNNLNIVKDTSFNGNIRVGGQSTFNELMTVIKNMIIMGDISLNGNLIIDGIARVRTQADSDNSTKVATTEFIKNQGYAKLSGANFTGDVSLNANFSVQGDVSLNNRLLVQEDVSLNRNLMIGGNVNVNSKLVVISDVSFNKSLSVAQTIYENGVSLNNKYATLESPTFTGTVSGIDASMVGLSRVDNTADTVKPVSVLQQAALNLKADLSSPTFTGIITIPTLKIGQTAFIEGDLSLNSSLFISKDLSLNGNMNIGGLLSIVTPASNDSSKKAATTEYVQNQGYAKQTGAAFTGPVDFNDKVSIVSDLSLNGRVFVNEDSHMNANAFIAGNLNVIKDVSFQGHLQVNKDVSMNASLFIRGDLSLNGNLTLNGTLVGKTPELTENSNVIATTEYVKKQGYALLSGSQFTGDVSLKDTSISGKLSITEDVSMNKRLFIGSDASVSGDLTVNGKSTLTGNVSLNSNVFIAKDLSLNGNLKIDGSIATVTPVKTDNSTRVATTAFIKNQGYATVESPEFTGTATATTLVVSQNLISRSDAYMENSLFITNDSSIGGNLAVTGKITSNTPDINENSSVIATTAFVKSQPFAKINSPIFTGKVTASDIDISHNLFILGDTSMNGNLNIYGVLTSVTPDTNENSTVVATTAFVKSQPFAKIDSPVFINKITAPIMEANSIYENGLLLASKYATLESPTFTGTVSGIDASMVGLSRVNNTADTVKPVSVLQQAALNLKANLSSPTFTGLVKTDYLDISNNMTIQGDASMNGNVNVDGTVTIQMPISLADNSKKAATTEYVQSQGYAKLSGATFQGDVSMNSNLFVYGNTDFKGTATVITPVASDNSNRVATTEYVKNQSFASLHSPAFTGVPTAPTMDTTAPTSTQIATTLYVENKISDFFNTASQTTLSAIDQLSQALSNTDASFAVAIANQLKTKANVESPTFSGIVNMPNVNISQTVSIGGDLSLNGNLVSNGLLYEKSVALENKYAKLNSPIFTGTVSGISKAMVQLSEVDNTADNIKPVSVLQQAALNLKANLVSPSFTGITKMVTTDISANLFVGGDISLNGNLIASGKLYENGLLLTSKYATLESPTFTGNVSGISKSMVQLSEVDNTADNVKPVSVLQQAALNLKADKESPNFTGEVSIERGLIVGSDVSINGIIRAITPATSDNSNKVATTAYVKNQNANYALLTGSTFTGDISLNGRLFVGKDTSINGNLFVAGNITGNYPSNSIPLSAVIGGLGTNVDLSTNQTIYGIKTFMNDVSFNGRLFLGGDMTISGKNIISSQYQTAVDPSSTTISNLTKLTDNYNGTFINELEVSKLNGMVMAYNTTNGNPKISLNGGQSWKTMSVTGTNTTYNAMLCISPDGRVILKQEYSSATSSPFLYISSNWGDSFTTATVAQPYIYNNAYYGYNNYNDQAYAFSQDGSVLYFIGYDKNNTVSLWKNTDASYTSFTKQGSSWNYSLSNCPRAIATSANGQYVLVITGIIPANGMYLYQSSNYGVSFTKTASGLNTTWNSIAVSQSGRYQTATNNNNIYVSSDFGITWTMTTTAPTAKWNFISMSNDGKNRIACIDNNYQYISLDQGIHWAVIPNSFGNWKKAFLLDLSGNNSIIIYSHDGMNVFKNSYKMEDTLEKTSINTDLTITSPYHYLNNIGKAINIIKSSLFNGNNGVKAAISSTGQYIVLPIQSQQSIMSQDYGSSWSYLPGLSSQLDYHYAAISGNGRFMFLRKGYTSYWSQNYGSNWSLFTSIQSNDDTNGIAVSYDGQYMVYVGLDSNSNSSIYISVNYGSSWILTTKFPTANTHFSVAISSTGQYMSALSTTSYLLTSNDYGVTWKIQNSLVNCNQVCVSSSGQYQTVISNTNIYISSNYGLNFTRVFNSFTAQLTTLTMIGSGEYQYVVNNETKQLVSSSDYGATWTPLYTNTVSPSNSIVSNDGTVMLYSASGDIYVSRMADYSGSISSTAVSISRKGIVSALDLTVNGSITSKNLIVDQIYENGNLLASKYATVNSPAFTGTVTGITKYMIDLSNVDNTSDNVKPVSSFQQAALNLKANVESSIFTGITRMQTVDISNSLLVKGDASMNGRLFISGDVSMNGILYANYALNTIPIDAIRGGIPSATGIFSYDISANLGLFVAKDVSFNSSLTVKGDTIVKNRLFVHSLIVNNDASFNNNIVIAGNIQSAKSLLLGESLYVNNSIFENGNALSTKYASLETPTFSGTATFDKIHITEDLLVSSNAFVDGNVTITQNLVTTKNISGNTIYENDVALRNKYSTIESPTFTGQVSGITKGMVGLSNVDNTSDNVKPISLDQQAALNLKANLTSPVFLGTPIAPTPDIGTNTSQIATTAYVRGEIYNLIGSAPSTLNTLQELALAINSDASFATTVAAEIDKKAAKIDPVFSGTVTVANLDVSSKAVLQGDISLNGRLFSSGDVSFNQNLYVNRELIVKDKVSIIGDLSVNGNIIGTFPVNSIPSTAIENIRNQYGTFQLSTQRADIVEFDDDHFELTRSSGDGSYVETLYSYNSDLSLNGNLHIHGTGSSVFSNNVEVDSNLTVTNDSSINGKLFVGQDVSMNHNLDLSGSLIAHNNVNVYGIINQYTLSLQDGYKENFDNEKQSIESLQSQVTSLQNQLTTVLQILASHNLA